MPHSKYIRGDSCCSYYNILGNLFSAKNKVGTQSAPSGEEPGDREGNLSCGQGRATVGWVRKESGKTGGRVCREHIWKKRRPEIVKQ